MIEIAGSDRKPQHLPIGSLKLFGINPYDEAIFRVVWSESRYYLVGGAHAIYDNNGPGTDKQLKQNKGRDPHLVRRETGYRWLPLYPDVRAWVLERWMSPLAFTGCTKEQYDERYRDPSTGLLTLGPYPDRGEYAQCFVFPVEPTTEMVHTKIRQIMAGWGFKYHEHLNAIQEQEKKKKKDFDNKVEAIFKDSQQAFGNRPVNINPARRTPKDIPLKYTADEVGLNTHGFSTR